MSEEEHLKKLQYALLVDELEYYLEDYECTLPENILCEIQTSQDIAYFIQCPRCNLTQKNVVTPPYCLECNWDSLTDPCLENTKTLTKGKKI